MSKSSTEPQVSQPPRILKLVILSVIIGLVGGILLMGVPGALILELVALIYQQFGMSPMALAGDSVWPIAIVISMLWPVSITPLAIIYYNMFSQHSVLGRWLFSVLVSVLLTSAVTFLVFIEA